jgi:ketosteroid isomerase-like protein
MRKLVLSLLLATVTLSTLQAQTPTDTLYQTIRKLDSLMFDAMNRQDLDAMMSYFHPDLEFYHDKGGMDNLAQTREKTKTLFKNNVNTGLRRTLIASSLKVYPVPGFGAIQDCLHQFCHKENGKDDCGTFKNIMVWKQTPNGWKVIRVLSYDH